MMLVGLSLLLIVAMILVAWAAFTLGDPARGELPRRPLPFPKKRTIPRHAQWTTTGATHRLVPPYVDRWTPPPPRPLDPGEVIRWHTR
jgi:hypothetical protein